MTWCSTRTENSADDKAHSGEMKTSAISTIAAQPARGFAARRVTQNASAASAAISTGSVFQRSHTSSGTAAGPQ